MLTSPPDVEPDDNTIEPPVVVELNPAERFTLPAVPVDESPEATVMSPVAPVAAAPEDNITTPLAPLPVLSALPIPIAPLAKLLAPAPLSKDTFPPEAEDDAPPAKLKERPESAPLVPTDIEIAPAVPVDAAPVARVRLPVPADESVLCTTTLPE